MRPPQRDFPPQRSFDKTREEQVAQPKERQLFELSEENKTRVVKILSGETKELVGYSEDLGRKLKDMGLATSQIRSIFGEVRSIEMNWPRNLKTDEDRQKSAKAQHDLRLLIPKLAYQAARIKVKDVYPVKELGNVLCPAIYIVLETVPEKRRESFQQFVEFFEAIIAYHRAYGGEN